MPSRNILCVTPDGPPEGLAGFLAAQGWDFTQLADLAAAQRLQGQRRFGVALLVLAGPPAPRQAQIEACVHAAADCEWIALCAGGALDSPAFCELLLSCFFAHLLLPADWGALGAALAQAAQRAALRERCRGPQRSDNALGMVGQSPAITQLRQKIRKVAATEAPVLVGGESGSGKELAAQAIHQCSARAQGPFVVVNCGAIAPTLIHSELFGYERGAFTGASSERQGLIEAANGGTLFLDEIGDLPLELQTNLLRFLQERTINRVGGVRNRPVDARVVAASHVDLVEAVAAGRFREDLYYRLNVLSLEVEPLRRRMEDVPMLADYFFERCAQKCRARARGFGRAAIEAMLAHPWPGNVRELHNRVQRAVVMTEARLIGPADLGLTPAQRGAGMALGAARTLAERDAIRLTLTRVGRNITHAARELGVSRMTLYRLMEKHGIATEALMRLEPVYDLQGATHPPFLEGMQGAARRQ